MMPEAEPRDPLRSGGRTKNGRQRGTVLLEREVHERRVRDVQREEPVFFAAPCRARRGSAIKKKRYDALTILI